jgi:hypothetical protein
VSAHGLRAARRLRLGGSPHGLGKLLVRHRQRHVLGDAPRDRALRAAEGRQRPRPELQAEDLVARGQMDGKHRPVARRRDALPIIGRFVNDVRLELAKVVDDLRQRFLRAPMETLQEVSEQGWELTCGEIDALVDTDAQLWGRVAAKLPSRLQRCSLRSDAPGDEAGG